MNLWHDIPLGEKAPEEFNVVVEIPKGSHNKYELDKETGLIKLDRANYSAAPYPVEYGFIPQTLADDGDAIDVLVLTTYPIPPGILVSVRPIALMEMTDDDESDNKIIVVPTDDMRWDEIQDLSDINKHTLKEIEHFFENIKKLKKKPIVTRVHGFKSKQDALSAIKESVRHYKEKFGK